MTRRSPDIAEFFSVPEFSAGGARRLSFLRNQAARTRSTARRKPMAFKMAARLLSSGLPWLDRVR